MRYDRADVVGKLCERGERVPVAGDQLGTAMFDDGQRPETIELELVDPLGIIEG